MTQPWMDPLSQWITRAVEAVSPSVVQIARQHRRGGRRLIDAVGSGLIWRSEPDRSLILTNAHVVGRAGEVTVLLPSGRRLVGRVAGRDLLYDVAVVEVAAGSLPTVRTGDSRQLKPGQVVIALGNPFGLGTTVTMGIVSAVDRSLPTPHGTPLDGLIQTDAPINPGNSGGPLALLDGRVVGLTTAKLEGDGLGFAVPIHLVEAIADQILEEGAVRHLWLGIQGYAEVIDDNWVRTFGLPADRGIVITRVVPSSPADKAGLQVFDMIVAVQGEHVDTIGDVRKRLVGRRPGDQVEVTVLRGAELFRVPVRLEEMPARRPTRDN
ncbi:MAG TPA: trypsin-like peptidase domain-containing protein [Thermaerobacter sp.]